MIGKRLLTGNLLRQRLHLPKYCTKKEFSATSAHKKELHQRLPHNESRLVVVGSGVAGCSIALIAAQKYNVPVTMLCAGDAPTDCNSFWAQGGIIYRNYDRSSGDSIQSLWEDVHRAGDGLCVNEAVLKLAEEGPSRVRELLLGSQASFADVPFDRDEKGQLKLCLEASHSAPRIIHKADHSGRAITEHIVQAAMNHPLINVRTQSIVTDLVLSETASIYSESTPVCLGVTVFDASTKKHEVLLSHKGVALASGGLAGIYTHSTNPPGFNAIGSSIALALRSRHALCRDLEYVQFHPTALKLPGEACFLLTEALRGEGAKLTTRDGYHFAKSFHPHGELAPRDIVARGVYAQSQNSEDGAVYLDITHRDASWLRKRFPSIYEKLLKDYGLDLTADKIPITPAAHYTCGGIQSDEHGRTTVPNLYVAGEAARTGLHGGNRLASTSLLEALVWGASVGDYVGGADVNYYDGSVTTEISKAANFTQQWARDEIERFEGDQHSITGKIIDNAASTSRKIEKPSNDPDAKYEATALLNKLKDTMWNKVGVVRTANGLQEAVQTLADIQQKAETLYQSGLEPHQTPTVERIMVRDASYAGLAVAKCALQNSKSRGAHFVLDDADEENFGQEAEEVERVAMAAGAM